MRGILGCCIKDHRTSAGSDQEKARRHETACLALDFFEHRHRPNIGLPRYDPRDKRRDQWIQERQRQTYSEASQAPARSIETFRPDKDLLSNASYRSAREQSCCWINFCRVPAALISTIRSSRPLRCAVARHCNRNPTKANTPAMAPNVCQSKPPVPQSAFAGIIAGPCNLSSDAPRILHPLCAWSSRWQRFGDRP